MRPTLALAAVLCLGTLVSADIIRLKDGRTFEGKAKVDGNKVVLDTGTIKATLAMDEVASIEYAPTKYDEYEQRLSSIPAGDIEGLHALARWCAEQGLEAQRKEVMRRILAANGDDEIARESLGYIWYGGEWLPESEVWQRQGFIFFQGRWVTPDEKKRVEDEAAEKKNKAKMESQARSLIADARSRNKTTGEAALEKLQNIAPQYKIAPFTEALKSNYAATRELAAAELAEIGNEKTVPALVKTMLTDPVRQVRNNAFNAVAKVGPKTSVPLLVDALSSTSNFVRTNAADALGEFGDGTVVVYLVRNLRIVWGGGPRCHIFVGEQTAYVKDYDMQVAASAVAADPVPGVVDTATVLDTRVIRIEEYMTVIERRVISRSLAKITGEDFGEDWRKWNEWLAAKSAPAGKE
ncbi:MAG: HEAT repeat domain-containing protein [Planctomycetota bacterium]|nr:HEAT repeat domain-containing protein [Planctomycetota bacterium]